MNQFPTYVVLPAEVVDRHLAAVSGVYVKVLLAVLRRQSADPAPIAGWLNLPESDVREAIGYWVNCGVLPGATTQTEKAVSAPAAAKPADKKPRLTAKEVTEHVAKNDQLRFILQTSEGIYGRPLTDTERRGLVYFYEELALPADVIVMAVDFCISNGKKQFNYLQKLCQGWAQDEINTHALAEEYIRRQSQRWGNEKLVMEAFGIQNRGLTADERRFISQWFQNLGYNIEMIRMAYERSVDKIGRLSFPYINKILQNWHEKGITSPDDVQTMDLPVRQPARTQQKNTSYDGDKFDSMGLELPPDMLDMF